MSTVSKLWKLLDSYSKDGVTTITEAMNVPSNDCIVRVTIHTRTPDDFIIVTASQTYVSSVTVVNSGTEDDPRYILEY